MNFKVGDQVRSFDFARPSENGFGLELEGERAAYVEGVITKIAPYEGCHPKCMHYHIRCTKRVLGGKEWPEDVGRIFYPVADETQVVIEGIVVREKKV